MANLELLLYILVSDFYGIKNAIRDIIAYICN